MLKNRTDPSICILGVKVAPITQRDLEAEIVHLLQTKQKQLLLNANAHCLNLAYENTWLRDFLNGVHLVYCDGYGVILAARLLGHHVEERITFGDWIYSLCDLAVKNGYKLFFLGSRQGVAEQAARYLQEQFPDLRIVGTHHGYFDKTPGSIENHEVIAEINTAQPDILFVSFGMPLQEKWLSENWESLNVSIGLASGAMLDYASRSLKRPPRWLTDHGLEWLGRLIIEPRRLWKRYLLGVPIFMGRVILQRLGFLRSNG